MKLDPELEAWVALSLIEGVGPAHSAKLLLAFGTPDEVLGASERSLAAVVPATVARAVRTGASGERLLATAKWLEDESNRVITLADAEYPKALLQITDPPPVLYLKGRADLLNSEAFAVVGSRNSTKQGNVHAEAFARTLSDAGLTIVSGLALGVDAAAHRGGLAGRSSSVAVVGTGLDIVYPARNRELAHALAAEGAIVSEFAVGTPPLPENFPRRNRLISGLSRGCLVVEAALSSGSLITARFANEQGKEVFAMPGSVNSPLSKGCHSLIKQGAKLVESAADILEELKLPAPQSTREARPGPTDPIGQRVLEELGFDPCDIDTLARRSGASAQVLAALLTQWEIEGLVEALPGGRYQRVQ